MAIYLGADNLFDNIIKQIGTIDENTQVDIATYSMYLDVSKGKDWAQMYDRTSARRFIDAVRDSKKLRLIVGIPYFMKEFAHIPEFVKAYNVGIERIGMTFKKLNLNGKVNASSHLKYYRIGDRVWIGGINLSGSTWVDVATEITDEKDKKDLAEIFNLHWGNSTTNIDQYLQGVNR